MEAIDPRAVLKRLVAESGESFAALSRFLGRNDAYLQQFVKRGTPRRLAEQDRHLLARYFRIDEAMLGGPQSAESAMPVVRIRRFDIGASAGPGGLVGEERAIGAMPFDPAILSALGVRERDASILNARGDSMEPTIHDGDRMLVDTSDRRPSAEGGIYVIRLDDVLLVKRLSTVAGAIRIASDNPTTPAIPERKSHELDIIGRVVWLARVLK